MALVNRFKLSQLVFAAMLLVQAYTAGLQLLSRVILKDGTFIFALCTYRNAVACLSVAPLALYFERSHEKNFGWVVCFWLYASGVIGFAIAGFYYYGLKDTTATYAINFFNLIPIFTFVLSIISGTEKLELGTKLGKIKTIGVLLCLIGALTTSLYKGKGLYIGHHQYMDSHITVKTSSSHAHWARGTFLLIASCLLFSLWFIVQRKLLEVFPFKYTSVMLHCCIICLQSATVGLCLDRHIAAWKLGWNIELITIVCSGVLSTGATLCLLSWAISIRGPTYPSMFNSISLILVAISEALILGEAIRVGSLIGMVLIVAGLYSFLWGSKKKEDGDLDSKKVVEIDTNTKPAELELKTAVEIGH